MTKQMLLKKLHAIAWKNDDIMFQEDLFALQHLIDAEIVRESRHGKMRITQLPNGYIKTILCTGQDSRLVP